MDSSTFSIQRQGIWLERSASIATESDPQRVGGRPDAALRRNHLQCNQPLCRCLDVSIDEIVC